MATQKVAMVAFGVLALTIAHARAATVYPNTTWSSIPGENTGGGSAAITSYLAYVDDVTIDFTNNTSSLYDFELAPTAAPEPATLALLGTGLAAVGLLRRKR